ncbi:MAG TPA: hypothetical protein DEB56_10070 [Thiobacillus sp.]|nr:hypothetical protein [Thiobacillus sp.]
MIKGSDVLVTTLVMLAERRGRPGEAVPDADLICYLATEVASLREHLRRVLPLEAPEKETADGR